ncbi:TraR/DksA C4-type zinc finger protein [Pseudoalteromonas obscura]|uniref:TraR/DksA C4-type zinc finger protein n=1 Tax=Pseudoalteromonas obscura TaxID=3048491 RepID=UPI0032E7F57F
MDDLDFVVNQQARAEQQFIDAQALTRARMVPSATHCVECGCAIPPARRECVPGVRHCVRCQSERE